MNTQTEITYELTWVASDVHPRKDILGKNYHAYWHEKTPGPCQEGLMLVEGMLKVIDCVENDLMHPPAVRVTQVPGQKPKACVLWDYNLKEIE